MALETLDPGQDVIHAVPHQIHHDLIQHHKAKSKDRQPAKDPDRKAEAEDVHLRQRLGDETHSKSLEKDHRQQRRGHTHRELEGGREQPDDH